jgi:type IV fimbrial biogenesis protein FimT
LYRNQNFGLLEMKTSRSPASGFTLLELMITVAIVAVAIQVAVPSLVTFQRNAELTSTANDFVSLLNGAKSEAMARGVSTLVVPTDGTNWSTGAVSFVDIARTGDSTSTGNLRLRSLQSLPSYLTVAGPGSFKFDPSGFAIANNGTISMVRNDTSGTEQLRQTRRVKVANTGRVRACTPTSSTDTNCTASTTSN